MKIGIEATFISPTHILGENRTKQRKPPKEKQHLREMKTSRQKTIEGISAGLTVRMRVITAVLLSPYRHRHHHRHCHRKTKQCPRRKF